MANATVRATTENNLTRKFITTAPLDDPLLLPLSPPDDVEYGADGQAEADGDEAEEGTAGNCQLVVVAVPARPATATYMPTGIT